MSTYMDKEAGKQCLLELADILHDLNLPFFLIQGTALGAYRDEGFTPTERDIDFGILQEDLRPVAVRLVQALVETGFEIETFNLPFQQCRTVVAYKYGAKADLVGLARWKNWRFTATPVRASVLRPYAIVHDHKILETHDEVALFGRKFFVPSPIEEYLELEYGADWRTPADDHVSRTRIYDFVQKERIPDGYLGPY